ncbi:flavin reductase family protein [Sporosarcina sp. P29]|uniref:flavin reductase family protein n=1 Tax=Sporosarcina sp. P29 TaxID=2048252 RepID=UPI000C16F8E4|nr:flavin reductase family protein [Sporosarcina sp. P29]PIC98273.1 oxidoreductase [Sporosarcina sp. P29]
MDSREFRNTLGNFATGVTVITTTTDKGEKIGLTANAFSSVSLDPPLVLVCIDKKSSSLQTLKKDIPFAINILQKEQEEDCWRFAKRADDKFSGASYTLSEDRVPLLNGNLATIECNVAEVIEGGDHYIVTGHVKNVSYDATAEPLLFFRGKIEQVMQVELA